MNGEPAGSTSAFGTCDVNGYQAQGLEVECSGFGIAIATFAGFLI